MKWIYLWLLLSFSIHFLTWTQLQGKANHRPIRSKGNPYSLSKDSKWRQYRTFSKTNRFHSTLRSVSSRLRSWSRLSTWWKTDPELHLLALLAHPFQNKGIVATHMELSPFIWIPHSQNYTFLPACYGSVPWDNTVSSRNNTASFFS